MKNWTKPTSYKIKKVIWPPIVFDLEEGRYVMHPKGMLEYCIDTGLLPIPGKPLPLEILLYGDHTK